MKSEKVAREIKEEIQRDIEIVRREKEIAEKNNREKEAKISEQAIEIARQNESIRSLESRKPEVQVLEKIVHVP